MFIQLKHKTMFVYQQVGKLITEVYKVSSYLPSEERFGMIQQIRRAVVSVKLNLSEGSARKSPNERIRFYEISRASLVEVDSILEIAVQLKYLEIILLAEIGKIINQCFAMITKMIESQRHLNR